MTWLESSQLAGISAMKKDRIEHAFGGDWTTDKLNRLRKYLEAYTQALKNQPFQLSYIDAFAGTGYRSARSKNTSPGLVLPELADEEAESYLAGSARIALEIGRPFDRYVFVEKSPERAKQLESLRQEFQSPSTSIDIVVGEANAYIKDLCGSTDWRGNRAVMFLDPYGMQVNWDTVEAIARTQAIDLWYLFPLAVNRLLIRGGKIDDSLRKRLDDVFGATDWYEAFYSVDVQPSLYGDDESVTKMATFQSIKHYMLNRLKGLFCGVANNPLELRNSRNTPLFLLCFAAGNPRGASIAVKIAQHILGK